MQLGLSGHIRLNNEGILLDGEMLYANQDGLEVKPFLKQLYTQLIDGYSKFHKMDTLSKMSVLMMETWLTNKEQEVPFDDTTAMVFANRSSSKRTDVLFEGSRAAQAASPSLFVYTLPNITIGEVSIKHKWTGESIFLIEKKLNYKSFHDMILSFSAYGHIKHVICGWVEDEHGLDGHLFIVNLERLDGDQAFDENTFDRIIRN